MNNEPNNTNTNANNETIKTEQLIKYYKEDPVQDNLRALVHQMKKTSFFVPGMFPDTPEIQAMKEQAKENPGVQVRLPEGTAPIPTLLSNAEGEMYFPIYTNIAQIPKEPKFDLIMNMPFKSCYTLALNEGMGTKGLLLNPFSDNLRFKKELLEAIKQEDEMLAAGAKQVRISPRQFQNMMRQKAEFRDLPLRLYGGKAEFVQQLSDEKEALVNEIYQKAFQQPELYPYGESDFSVMALNISDELLLVRIDLPEIKDQVQLCHRIYVTLNPATEEVNYFTIEQGKEKGERRFGGITSEQKHVEYGEAPVEGAEIQRVMDLLEQNKEQTS